MPTSWGAWASSLVALGAVPAFAAPSLLPTGSLCEDYAIASITSQYECFSVAAPAIGFAGKATLALDGLGFTGCIYNTAADIIMYGTSVGQSLTLPSYQYICMGTPSTTTTTTKTTYSFTTSTVTKTVEAGIYSLLDHFESCQDNYAIPDVDSESMCFGAARAFLGLTSYDFIKIDGIGFSGCVFNTQNNLVLYGTTQGGSGVTSHRYKYICQGRATTTSTTTTMTSSTSTATTMTTSTSTKTTSTSTATTSTITTTTFTSTTTSRTSTTSTRTTSTSTTTTTLYDPWAGFVGEDPITLFRCTLQRFYLPEGELVPLLQSPEMRVLAAAFRHGHEQWIRQVAVEGPNGESVLKVRLRDDFKGLRVEELPHSEFKTLNVTLDWLGGMHLQHIPGTESYAFEYESSYGTLYFVFGAVPGVMVGQANAETVVVVGETAKIVILSSASGFENEAPEVAAEFAHLDFVLQMKKRDVCEGILPELWGVKPVTQETLSLLEPIPEQPHEQLSLPQ